MIISDEQALLAAQYLHSGPSADMHPSADVSDSLLAAAHAIVDGMPEMRDDRVSEARAYLGSGSLDSHEVASKMISRIISDSLR